MVRQILRKDAFAGQNWPLVTFTSRICRRNNIPLRGDQWHGWKEAQTAMAPGFPCTRLWSIVSLSRGRQRA